MPLEVETFDIRKLVVYKQDLENDLAVAGVAPESDWRPRSFWDETKTSSKDQVLGLREVEVSKALFQGQPLDQKIPSQWGDLHLFDLCLTFGLHDTAFALAEGGVKGCRLEAYHLGPYAYFAPYSPPWRRDGKCLCHGWQTCRFCTWGFPEGIWMRDWDVRLDHACHAAHEAARKPFVLRVLAMVLSNAPMPFELSDEAMARLLDIEILMGNQEAARALANSYGVRPLRRWVANGRFLRSKWSFGNPSTVLLAALLAGAKFDGMFVDLNFYADFDLLWFDYLHGYSRAEEVRDVPLREALFAAGFSLEGFEGLLQTTTMCTANNDPQNERPWEPHIQNNLGRFLCTRGKLSLDRLHEAQRYGIDVSSWFVVIPGSFPREDCSLLELAIIQGCSDCAALCAETDWEIVNVGICEEALEPVRSMSALFQQSSPEECRCAAIAAARSACIASWTIESTKGVAIFQFLKQLAKGKSFPLWLVNQILSYAMELPGLVEQLDLSDDLHGWQNFLVFTPALGSNEHHNPPKWRDGSLFHAVSTMPKLHLCNDINPY